MSLDAVQMIIQRGASDKRFRKQLLNTPEVTLREPGLKLTDVERLALEDLIGILREEKPRPQRKLPPFRESIVACLSVILTLLLIGMIWATLTEAKTPMGKSSSVHTWGPAPPWS